MKILMLIFSIQAAFAQISVKEDKKQETVTVKKKIDQKKAGVVIPYGIE